MRGAGQSPRPAAGKIFQNRVNIMSPVAYSSVGRMSETQTEGDEMNANKTAAGAVLVVAAWWVLVVTFAVLVCG